MSDPLFDPPDPPLEPPDPPDLSDSGSQSQADSQPEPLKPLQPSAAVSAATMEPGLTLHLLLQLPDPQRELINWMLRQSQDCTLAQIREYLQQDEAETRSLLEPLVSAGFLQTRHQSQEIYYHVEMRSMRQSRQWRSI